jgi:hypothetical protein
MTARHIGSFRKRGEAEIQHIASAHISLGQLLESLDLDIRNLHKSHPKYAVTLRVWTDELVAAGVLTPGLDTKGCVLAILDWFGHVRELYETENEASVTVSAMDDAEHRKVAAERGRIGRLLGRQVSGLKAEGDADRVNEVRANHSLPALPIREPKTHHGVTVKTQLGEFLMSMMLAAGFGSGVDGQKYTVSKAAHRIVRIAAARGFTLNSDSLCTRASQLKKG